MLKLTTAFFKSSCIDGSRLFNTIENKLADLEACSLTLPKYSVNDGSLLIFHWIMILKGKGLYNIVKFQGTETLVLTTFSFFPLSNSSCLRVLPSSGTRSLTFFPPLLLRPMNPRLGRTGSPLDSLTLA